MNVLFSETGKLLVPHLLHTLKSYYYSSDLPIFYFDIETLTHHTYPENHFIHQTNTLFSAKDFLSTYFEDQIKNCTCLEDGTYSTFSHTLFDFFHFLLAPITLKAEVKGFLVAGPLLYSRDDLFSVTTYKQSLPATLQDLVDLLSAHAILKLPPRQYYLSQLLQHLIQKSIYIGPHEALKTQKHFMSLEDMAMHNHYFHLSSKMTLVSSLVLKSQKDEALSLYKKSLLYGDLTQLNLEQMLLTLKESLISLDVLISHQLLNQGYELFKIATLKKVFFEEIYKAKDFPSLVSYGEHMIQTYSDLLTEKSLEGKSSLVQKTLLYIQTHFKQDLDIEKIAKELQVSKTTLCTHFKSDTGYTINQQIKKTRISYAKHLLTYTDEPLFTIALQCGFDNQNYFSTVFKSVEGITPLHYRNQKTAATPLGV
jgi:AraC-like DNA-binding protein